MRYGFPRWAAAWAPPALMGDLPPGRSTLYHGHPPPARAPLPWKFRLLTGVGLPREPATAGCPSHLPTPAADARRETRTPSPARPSGICTAAVLVRSREIGGRTLIP